MTTATLESKPKMKVPLLDLHAQHDALREELRAALDRVMQSGQFILGPDVRALEEEVASYSGMKHAVACASGSDALLLALMALGVGAGDEVITTPYSFFASTSAITRLGARPIFVDIDPRTYNLDANKLGDAITDRTRAILPVHLYGQCAEMNPMLEVGERRGIPIVEDAAQAIGAEDAGRRAGSMGTIGCLSFYPSKNLGGMGDGGMLLTNDDKLAARLKILHVHGAEPKYYHREVGINSRLDSFQAAVLRVKLPHLDNWSAARARNAGRYQELFANAGLAEHVSLPFARRDARHTFNQYIIRVGTERDPLFAHLKENGVGTDLYYPVPLHLQECFNFLGYEEGVFPEAERAARETLALPIYPELTAEQQEYVVQVIRDYFA